MIKPLGHGERFDSRLHYRIVNLNEMPEFCNVVHIVWSVSFLDCLKLLISKKLFISFKAYSIPPMRIDTKSWIK